MRDAKLPTTPSLISSSVETCTGSFLYTLCCRIATHWVSQHRSHQNPGDPTSLAKFLEQVKDEDLDYCKIYTQSHNSILDDEDWNPDEKFFQCEYLETKVRLVLLQGEIEIDLGQLAQAKKHISVVKDTIADLSKAATGIGRTAPRTERINRRITSAEKRVRERAEAASSCESRRELRPL